MASWLAPARTTQCASTINRFDPRFWCVNFPRPMMAAITTPAYDALTVNLVFYKQDDLAGLIWFSADSYDHPLLAYETNRDYRNTQLSFTWQSSGVVSLDAVNGPTLTIEGRDASGTPQTWYVRLWNYATGDASNADIKLDFNSLVAGWSIAGGTPIYTGDIDKIFISLVPNGYTGQALAFPAAQEALVRLSNIKSSGSGAVLEIGDVLVPAHDLRMATAYDDSYNLTPARLVRNMLQLGYRGDIVHYVGMSHYMRLEANSGGFYVSLAGGVLNAATQAWHADYAAKLAACGYGCIWSLSYELFDSYCWNDWKQRTWDGAPAQTGYTPPSTLLSPAHSGAMGYLQAVAQAFVGLGMAAGLPPKFQVGEPWWWVMPDGRICLYDTASKAALGGAPVVIANVHTRLSGAQQALLDAAGAVLAHTTAALVAAVKGQYPNCVSHLLTFLPTNLDPQAPDLIRANIPLGWAAPAFDILQLEDYDWVTAGNVTASAHGAALVSARLNYPPAQQHYFAGYATSAALAEQQWPLIDAAIAAGQARGVAATYIWALPEIIRDGYTYFQEGEIEMQAFDDVLFPLAIGRHASVEPNFSTSIVTTASGYEQRNVNWASARLHFDAGLGVRSETDLETLLAFFRARRGAARGFRFTDPYDFSSNAMVGVPSATDQTIGVGDGVTASFQLVKTYGTGADAEVRKITRPQAVTLLVAVDGVAISGGAATWACGAGGMVIFTTPPATGAIVTAGYYFDVPVRFAQDKLSIDVNNFLAGSAVSVPLVEVRE